MDKRVEKVKTWLKEPWNLALVLIIISAFAIRLYFFINTSGQTIWFDEAEYMSLAKKWAFGVPYDANPQRPPLFQFISALAFIIGLGEAFIKFALVLIPSTFLIFAVYLLGKEMYSKEIGIIAALLTSVSWTLLFWGARVQPDFFSMVFQVLSLVFIWKYWKIQGQDELSKKATKFVVISAVLAALSFYFKITGLLVPMIVALFILVKDRISAFKNRDYWIYAGAFLATLIPYFIWAKLSYGSFLAFRAGYGNPTLQDWPFAWEVLGFLTALLNPSASANICNPTDAVCHSFWNNAPLLFKSIFNFNSVLYVSFVIGAILAIKFLFYTDVLIKDKKKCFDANLFAIISLLYIAGFYIFYQRAIEDRWVFLWLPFMFFFVGNALQFIYRTAKKYNKTIAIVLVLGLLAFGGYSQLKHAGELIENKKGSYKPVELSGIWMKDNSSPEDIILTRSKTQHTYYAERRTKSYNDFVLPEEMNAYITENKPKFFIISIFEPNPDWTQEWINQNQNRLNPVQVYTTDGTQEGISLVIYEIVY